MQNVSALASSLSGSLLLLATWSGQTRDATSLAWAMVGDATGRRKFGPGNRLTKPKSNWKSESESGRVGALDSPQPPSAQADLCPSPRDSSRTEIGPASEVLLVSVERANRTEARLEAPSLKTFAIRQTGRRRASRSKILSTRLRNRLGQGSARSC